MHSSEAYWWTKAGRLSGVAYVDRDSKTEVEVYAKVIVLAPSCVETAHIMLNSRSRHWPTGIANSSGQIGRNLCDHLYGCPGYGCLPQLIGQPPTRDKHRWFYRRLAAALAESQESAGGEVYPRLLNLHRWRLSNIPRILSSIGGLWRSNTNARSTATTPLQSPRKSRLLLCLAPPTTWT